jgi:ketosteroid isomerase-like protein
MERLWRAPRVRRSSVVTAHLISQLAGLPRHLTVEVGGARVGIVHGDPESLAGWRLALEAMEPVDPILRREIPRAGALTTASVVARPSSMMRDTGRAVSQENVDLVRRLYAELASEGSTQEFEQRMSDDALGRFLDPEIEWIPVTGSLLAVDSYHGFDGVRRFWGEFLSAWETYRVETLRFDDAGDQVAVVVHIVGRTHELEVDETRSSLLTVRDGRVVRVESFADPAGARQAAGLPP